MIDERFLADLAAAFPSIHRRVDAAARDEAAELLRACDGDVSRALVRARLQGAGRLWWPYVKGSVPFGDEREAMEGFARLVLVVFHLVGRPPAGAEEARAVVVGVLRESLDVERIVRAVRREPEASTAAAAGGAAGFAASLGTIAAPIQTWRAVRKYARFVPKPVKVAAAAAVLAALASVPLVAGWSAGMKAERAAREPAGGGPAS